MVSGQPQPTVVWLFNDNPVNTLSNVYPRGNVLTVRDAAYELNGYFTCRAVAPSGQSAQDLALVRVMQREEESEQPQQPQPYPGEEVEQRFDVEISPRSANPSTGETIRFSCVVRGDNSGQFRYRWSRQGGSELPAGSDPNDSGILTLFNLQEQDSGVYICEVDNLRNGQTSRAVAQLAVAASGAAAAAAEAPLKIEVVPSVANLIQGRDAEFVCNVQGGRNPTVAWKRINENLDPARHVVMGNKLLIRGVEPNDRGYFECQAESGSENVREYVRVDVEAREAPRIELYPQQEQIEIDYNSGMYAQCRVVAGIPTPKIEWRRSDGRPISDKVIITQEGSLLEIREAGSAEFGTYECVAKNDEGESSARLTVVSRPGQEQQEQPERPVRPEEPYRPVYPPNREEQEQPEQAENREPVITLPSNYVEGREGESVTLRCQTDSRDVRIDWMNPSGEYLPSESDGSLILYEAKRADSGYYICSVTNRYGSTRAQLQLQISGEQPRQELKVQLQPKTKSVSVGGSAEFVCNVVSGGGGGDRSEPLLRWSRAGGASMPTYHTVSGNILRIQNVQEEDAGRYICTAQTTDGSMNFDAAYLQISKRDPNSAFPVFIRMLESPTDTYQPQAAFRYGVRVTAECVAQTQDIEDISWSKVEGVNRAIYNRNDNSNTMTIDALVPMDLGTYVCIATTRSGLKAQNVIVFTRSPNVGNQFTYEVKGPSEPVSEQPEPEPEQPEQPQNGQQNEQPNNNNNNNQASAEPTARIVGEKQIRTTEGSSVEIDCEVDGAVKVEWERHGGDIPDSKRIQSVGRVNKLMLYNLKQADSGYYICNAENGAGRTRDYAYLEISARESGSSESNSNSNNDYDAEREESERREREQREREQREREREEEATSSSKQQSGKPLVLVQSLFNGQPIQVGKEVKIACLVTDPEAQVVFTRADGAQSERVTLETSESKTNYLLVISPFEAEDAGQYRCYARNRNGESDDVAYVELEADQSYSFKTKNSAESQDQPDGNPRVSISSMGSLENGNMVELSCALQDDNGVKVNDYSWGRYPALPKTAQVQESRLIISQFDAEQDNGLYTCRAATSDKDYQKTKLIASRDYLLSKNPYFSFSKHDDDSVLVKCRPNAENSNVEWKADANVKEDAFKVEGSDLIVYKSDYSSHFSCLLKSDSELGSTSLDLEVSRDLMDKIFENVNVDIAGQQEVQEGANANVECTPGENC
jgi:hypothetical protein